MDPWKWICPLCGIAPIVKPNPNPGGTSDKDTGVAEDSVSLSGDDVSLDEVVNVREVSDSGIEVVRWRGRGGMDPGHHACSSWGGFGRLKMKRYGSEMGSVHGMSTNEVLQGMWKKSKGLYGCERVEEDDKGCWSPSNMGRREYHDQCAWIVCGEGWCR